MESRLDVLCVVPPFIYGDYANIVSKSPNLGMAIIAAYLEEHGFSVHILDAFALNLSLEQIKEHIQKEKPRILFIGSVTSTHSISLDILKAAQHIDPQIVTVIGGPHVSNLPSSAFPPADYAVIGEGEATALELTQHILGKKKSIALKKILGIAYMDKGTMILTGKRPFIEDLNTLPLPAYHLLPMEVYKSYGWLDTGRQFSTMITSRGCPFRCSFCASSKNFEHLWRFRNAENIFKEMKLLYEKYNIRHIYFQDDEFCVHRGRVMELCKLIKEAKMDMIWECLARVVSVDDELLKEMYSAGCRSIAFGIEMGYEEGWKRINKPITKELVMNAIKLTQKNHIMAKCSFVTGFPWESEKEIKQTIKFAKQLNPDIVFFTTLNPFPGTYIWEQYFKDNDTYITSKDLNSFVIHGADPVIRTQHLTAKELEYWNGRAYLEFYLRPRYILRKLRSMNNFTDLKRNVSSGLSLLKLATKRFVSHS